MNWTLAAPNAHDVTGITVFYKIDNGGVSFNSEAHPESVRGSVLESLEKFTPYKITVCATTVNGTGIPSKLQTAVTWEDGKCCQTEALGQFAREINVAILPAMFSSCTAYQVF